MAARLTREEELLGAFEVAGRRGLTEAEMRRHGGARWRAIVRKLEDRGHIFNVHASRFTGRPYRWVHLGPQLPPPAELESSPAAEPVPPQMALPVLKARGHR